MLLSPFGPAFRMHSAESALYEASCLHGNAIPDATCACGAHFVPGANLFAEPLAELPKRPNEIAFVATLGYGVGKVLPEFNPVVHWGQVRAMRAERYRIIQMVSDEHLDVVNRGLLLARYRVPITQGIDEPTCSRLEAESVR